jgi:hypothetical protein
MSAPAVSVTLSLRCLRAVRRQFSGIRLAEDV